ncbi:hypothetical protein [Sporosarcina sp. BP05]|uniref:hypothetical protein n=1 Tax=Sporosarcina sp. BP05 TaxID=2758726 RepID=UPI0016492C99|nr:hypothetical protein [Sporosarcina sp. BP05]
MEDYKKLEGKTISKIEVKKDRTIDIHFTDGSAVYLDVELEGGAILTDGYFPAIKKLSIK